MDQFKQISTFVDVAARGSLSASARAEGVAPAVIGRRLDAIDRRISETREASDEAVAKAVQGIETRLADTTPRPAGRRTRPAPDSLAAAVAEIRQRQQQLDEGGPDDDRDLLVDGLRRDLARVMETTAADALSPAIAGLQAETTRLRESIGALATSGDLVTLEQAVRTLADEVQRARDPADLVAVAGPIDLMRVQVGRLAIQMHRDDGADRRQSGRRMIQRRRQRLGVTRWHDAARLRHGDQVVQQERTIGADHGHALRQRFHGNGRSAFIPRSDQQRVGLCQIGFNFGNETGQGDVLAGLPAGRGNVILRAPGCDAIGEIFQ